VITKVPRFRQKIGSGDHRWVLEGPLLILTQSAGMKVFWTCIITAQRYKTLEDITRFTLRWSKVWRKTIWPGMGLSVGQHPAWATNYEEFEQRYARDRCVDAGGGSSSVYTTVPTCRTWTLRSRIQAGLSRWLVSALFLDRPQPRRNHEGYPTAAIAETST
jgi:hypothetical protein